MAKYSRYDPRNKKRGNHKTQSENKDLRLREINDRDNRVLLQEVMHDDEYDYENFDNQQLNG
tara:strand:- start:11 stop:196 length:186 start_codon:yes stop_codon:yes gene_type:complete